MGVRSLYLEQFFPIKKFRHSKECARNNFNIYEKLLGVITVILIYIVILKLFCAYS